MRHTKFFAVCVGMLICVAAQAGDVYKYVDERGATLYTDKPIPGAVLVSTGTQRPPEVSARTYAATQSATNGQLAASNQRIADSQNDSRVAANVAKDLEASRAERCKQAREAYTKSINSQRLYRQTADGKREYLNDAELAQTRIDSAKAVDTICGPQG
ncbi:MAG: DUF4124 domain-containing protein [Pseudomonadota bacterium]